MSYQDLFNYNAVAGFQNKVAAMQGPLVNVYIPVDTTKTGYEDKDNAGKWQKKPYKCLIDWNPKRSVFYHFNIPTTFGPVADQAGPSWYGEDISELIVAWFAIDAVVPAGSYIRTKVIDQVSPYGDQILSVVHIEDEGKYKVLKRTWFLRPISDDQLYTQLTP
jgi:hypothetical protein